MRKRTTEEQPIAEALRQAPGITAAQLQRADPEILTLEEAAAILQRSVYQTRVYVHEGKLPAYQLRPAGKMLVRRADLDRAFRPAGEPAYLNASEAAELLRVSRKTLYEATEAADLQRDPLNNLYRRRDLLGLLQPVAARAPAVAERKTPYSASDPGPEEEAETP